MPRVSGCSSVLPIEQIVHRGADTASRGNFFEMDIAYAHRRGGGIHIIHTFVVCPGYQGDGVFIFSLFLPNVRIVNADRSSLYRGFPEFIAAFFVVVVQVDVGLGCFVELVGLTVYIAEVYMQPSGTGVKFVLDARGEHQQSSKQYRE